MSDTYPGATPEQLARLADPGPLAPHLQSVVSATNRDKTKAQLVAYIDATAARGLLDRILGPQNWSAELTQAPTPTAGGFAAVCRLSMYVQGRERPVVRDSAGSNDGGQLDTGLKGADSDSFKRACARAGLGAALARLSKEWVPQVPLFDGADKKKPDPAAVERTLVKWRQQLATWQGKIDATRSTPPTDAAPVEEHGPAPAPLAEEAAAEEPAVPAGHEVNPETGEVTPSPAAPVAAAPDPTDPAPISPNGEGEREQAAAVDAGQAQTATDGDVARAAMAALADSLEAPGPGSRWEERQGWLRSKMGGRPGALVVLEAAAGERYESKMKEDVVWMKVLRHMETGLVDRAAA